MEFCNNDLKKEVSSASQFLSRNKTFCFQLQQNERQFNTEVKDFECQRVSGSKELTTALNRFHSFRQNEKLAKQRADNCVGTNLSKSFLDLVKEPDVEIRSRDLNNNYNKKTVISKAAELLGSMPSSLIAKEDEKIAFNEEKQRKAKPKTKTATVVISLKQSIKPKDKRKKSKPIEQLSIEESNFLANKESDELSFALNRVNLKSDDRSSLYENVESFYQRVIDVESNSAISSSLSSMSSPAIKAIMPVNSPSASLQSSLLNNTSSFSSASIISHKGKSDLSSYLNLNSMSLIDPDHSKKTITGSDESLVQNYESSYKILDKSQESVFENRCDSVASVSMTRESG